MSIADNQQAKSSHMASPWVTMTHIAMTCFQAMGLCEIWNPCGNIRIKDAHGKFLLNTRPKLNSNSKFEIKSQ